MTGFEICRADSDEPMGILTMSRSEVDGISEMTDGKLGFPQVGLKPTASLPSPGGGWIERQRSVEQSVCGAEVVHHRVHGATGRYNEWVAVDFQHARAIGQA